MISLLFSNYVLVYQKKERVSRNLIGKYSRRSSHPFREILYIKQTSADDFISLNLKFLIKYNQI